MQFVVPGRRERPERTDPERLREAAGLIRRRAGRTDTDPDAYYGLFTPASGAAVADLLEMLASDMEINIGYPGPGWAEALRVAHNIENAEEY